jgi:hypothetical protein
VGDPFVLLFGLWEFFGFDITGPPATTCPVLGHRRPGVLQRELGLVAVLVVQTGLRSRSLAEDLLFRGVSAAADAGRSSGRDFVATGGALAFYTPAPAMVDPHFPGRRRRSTSYPTRAVAERAVK